MIHLDKKILLKKNNKSSLLRLIKIKELAYKLTKNDNF